MGRRDREPKKKKKGGIGSFFSTLVILAALGVFCYAGYQLFLIYMDYKVGVDEYGALEALAGDEKTSEGFDEEQMAENETMGEDQWGDAYISNNASSAPLEKMENPINFEELRAINEDVIGWLEMEAVDINYPIAQGEDNDFYLHRTFRKQDNFAGSIFLDYLNRPDFSNRNNIVYGHNMKNLSMFGKLKQYKEQETFDKSPYFWIYTPTKIYKYEIFAASVVGTYSDSYKIIFSDVNDFQTFLDQAAKQSVIQTKAKVGYADTVVTLSTCTGDNATRFIVQGKRVRTFQAVPKAGGYDSIDDQPETEG